MCLSTYLSIYLSSYLSICACIYLSWSSKTKDLVYPESLSDSEHVRADKHQVQQRTFTDALAGYVYIHVYVNMSVHTYTVTSMIGSEWKDQLALAWRRSLSWSLCMLLLPPLL